MKRRGLREDGREVEVHYGRERIAISRPPHRHDVITAPEHHLGIPLGTRFVHEATGEERYVGVPEEGGRNVISSDPLEHGSVYAASVDDQGKVGLCRVEVGSAGGTGRLKLA